MARVICHYWTYVRAFLFSTPLFFNPCFTGRPWGHNLDLCQICLILLHHLISISAFNFLIFGLVTSRDFVFFLPQGLGLGFLVPRVEIEVLVHMVYNSLFASILNLWIHVRNARQGSRVRKSWSQWGCCKVSSSMEIVVDGLRSNDLPPFCYRCLCDLFILVADCCLVFGLA